MNLVMIGRFREARDAEEARKLMEAIIRQATEEFVSPLYDAKPKDHRFSNEMRNILDGAKIYDLSPQEVQQFAFDVRVKDVGSEVTVTTDESDVSGFLKVLLDRGARIEVYSKHDYTDSERDAAV
jgi:hypothetical protein